MALSEVDIKDYKEAGYTQPSANDTQVGGTHYKKYGIQPWDFVYANGLGYFEGSAIKYISRWKDKGGVADIEKAIHFLQKLVELERGVK